MSSSGITDKTAITAIPKTGVAVTDPVLSGGGEMGARMRELDWSKTAVGPVESWPQTLKAAVRIILASRYAMFIWWGRELVNLYNDSYVAFLGSKHPDALGKSGRDVWEEIWEQIGPRADAVLLRGESTYDESLLLLMERHGYTEETYFTFSYSPLPDDEGKIGGLFCAVTEVTQQVIGERRLRLLREIAAEMGEARTPAQVCQSAARSVSGARRDLPFSLIYLLEPDGKTLKRACEVGIAGDHPLAPETVTLGEGGECAWPFRAVMESGEPIVVDRLAERVKNIPMGEWNRPPENAVLMPIAHQGQSRPAGVFIAGINPYRKFDYEFKGFLSLLTSQIAAAIANARAYEQERQRAESLAELDRAKTLFFSNVSHEFRTPLTLMLGPLEGLLETTRGQLAPQHWEQISVAHRNALRLLKLVNNLLDFSRLEAGRVEAVYQPTDIAALTMEIASVFRSAMEKAELHFSVECEPLQDPLYVDRDMWEKIVLNLLSNAFKFTFEGSVTLTLKPAGSTVELSVRDTGVGIPEEERERVFERFHRIESARSRTYEGTGIGLSLVQELARLHGGTVRVESTLGSGSTFTVSIPRGKEHLPPDRIQEAHSLTPATISAEAYVEEAQRWLPRDSGSAMDQAVFHKLPSVVSSQSAIPLPEKELIVVADDNADMRDYMSRLLSDQYRVHSVADGIEAVEAVRKLRPALVLTDAMMPKLDGFEVLQAIRSDSQLNNIPVILLSARAGEESRVEGLQAGADDYLAKPFTARELTARIGAHVKMARLRRDAAEREVRLRAEAELERRRLQELLQQAPAAIALLNGPEHRWVYVNEEYVRVTGRSSAADFLGKTLVESLPELQTQEYADLLDHVYRTGEPYIGREAKATLNRSASGQPDEVYFDFVYQPVRNAEGLVEGVLVHAVEVTDRVVARKTIEKSEQRFRALADAIPQLVWMANPDGWIFWYNQQWYAYTGTTPEQMEGWGWQSVHDPAMLPAVLERWKGSIASGEPFEMTFPLRGADGVFRRFLTRGVPVRDEQGRITRWFGTNTDISVEAKTQDELRRVQERLQIELINSQKMAAIVESSDDAIVSKDLNGIVRSWNRSAERLFGYKAEEIVGRSILLIIPPELQSDEDMILSKIRAGEKIDHFETVRITKTGERLNVSLSISPVRDEQGRIIGAAKIARDITENKKIEQALRTTEKLAAAGRLAATVAHEINNPLEAVTNLVYLARRDLPDDEKVAKHLQMAGRELDRVAHIARQTLGFYRDTSSPTTVRVAQTMDDLLLLYEKRFETRKITVDKRYEEDLEITALAGEIRQAFSNLISNATDAMPSGGVLVIRVSKSRRWNRPGAEGVRITVLDTGSGIAPQHKARLFQPFFTTKADVGTGLGLWITRGIVERHSGSIQVKSRTGNREHGTVFSIFLPFQGMPGRLQGSVIKENGEHAAVSAGVRRQ